MPRAQYVYTEGQCWYAVFGEEVELDELNGMARQLNQLPRVNAGAIKKVLADNTIRPALIVMVRKEHSQQAITLLKELADPLLSITIKFFQLTFVYCPCGHKSISGHAEFLDGFAPEDEAAFRQQYTAALTECNLFPLWEAQPGPASDDMVMPVTKVFRALKAILEEMFILESQDPRHCALKDTHPEL